jgi:plasmid stability protein
VAAFHLRNIPDRLYRRLKARAKRNGRSVNAELIEILEDALARPTAEELEARLAELHATTPPLSPDAPTPEQIIREGREERERHFEQLMREHLDSR